MHLLFVFIAGFINSFMDRITFNEEGSIFHEKDWSPFQTFDAKKKFLGIVQFDPWHISKYFVLGALFTGYYFFSPFTPYYVADITIIFTAWWFGFEAGWRLFKRKL